MSHAHTIKTKDLSGKQETVSKIRHRLTDVLEIVFPVKSILGYWGTNFKGTEVRLKGVESACTVNPKTALVLGFTHERQA